MHQTELTLNAEKRFRKTCEKVTSGKKIIVEMIDHALLGWTVEIDQDIAAG